VHRDGRIEMFISAPLIGRASNRWSVQVTRPLFSDSGGFAGVAVVSIDPLLLSGKLAEIMEGSGAVAAVLRDPDGTLLARSRDAATQMGRSLARQHPVIAAAHDAAQGAIRAESVVDGREVIFGFRRVSGAPIVVTVAEDWELASAPLHQLARWVRITYGVVLLLALAGGLLGLKSREARQASLALAEAEGARAATEAAWAELERLLTAAPAAIRAGELRNTGDGAPGPLRPHFVSANIERVTGWPAERIATPGALFSLMDEADRAGRRDFRATLLREGSATIEYRLRRPDDSWCWIREESRTVGPTPRGGVEVISYLSDVTEHRRLQAQAFGAAKLATLGEMAANLAHELNQPLAVVSLASENAAAALAEDGAAAIPDAMETLELVAQQAARCKALVQHLRMFSRPDKAPSLAPVALQGAVDGALLLTGGALRDAEVRLEVTIPEDLPLLLADQVAAEQVLVNLLLNARDALLGREAGPPRRIAISAREADGGILVLVADNGGGIAPEFLDRIFEPFFTTKSAEKGTGLGLAICHAIMRGFGGDIRVENTAEGAEFTLRFRPAAEAPPEAGHAAPELAA
jgi:signal transduction histidine kinase